MIGKVFVIAGGDIDYYANSFRCKNDRVAMIEIKQNNACNAPTKKYPVGASVLHTGGGTTIMQGGGGGESVDIVKRDDIMVFHSG